jgi:hypothetical protein
MPGARAESKRQEISLRSSTTARAAPSRILACRNKNHDSEFRRAISYSPNRATGAASALAQTLAGGRIGCATKDG